MIANYETTDKFAELKLTPRQIELLLWQMLMDMAEGDLSVIPAEDTPGRRVIFVQDGEYIEMLCDGAGDDE